MLLVCFLESREKWKETECIAFQVTFLKNKWNKNKLKTTTNLDYFMSKTGACLCWPKEKCHQDVTPLDA